MDNQKNVSATLEKRKKSIRGPMLRSIQVLVEYVARNVTVRTA